MNWHTTTPPRDGKRFLGQRKVYHFNSHPKVWAQEYVGNRIEELEFIQDRFQAFSFGACSTDSFSEKEILMWTRDYPIDPAELEGIQELTISL